MGERVTLTLVPHLFKNHFSTLQKIQTMGLDMYLTGKKFIWSSNSDKELCRKQLAEILKSEFEPNEISFQLAYWRKCNQIHNWFIKNIQAGKDDCNAYIVSREDLVKLLAAVIAVIANNELAPTMLPTQPGFFFGSTEYNTDYFDDLKETRTMIEKVLKSAECKDMDFEYKSSW